jgi:hypothetical protein
VAPHPQRARQRRRGRPGRSRATLQRGRPQHRTYYEELEADGYAITHVGVEHFHLDPPIEQRVPGARLGSGREWREYRTARGLGSSRRTAVNRLPNVEWSGYRTELPAPRVPGAARWRAVVTPSAA